MKNKIFESRVVRNFSMLLFSDVAVSVISVFNVLMIINAIGTEHNGMIVMIQAYVGIILSIFTFSSFNGLISFLPKYIYKNDIEKIKKYINEAIMYEVVAGIVAFVVGQLMLKIVADFMGWDSLMVIFIRIYLFSCLLNIVGVTGAVIRLYDKFKYLSFINIITAIIRVVGYVIGFFFIRRLEYFIAMEFFIDIVVRVLYIICMIKVCKEKGLMGLLRIDLKIDKEFFKFNLLSNIASTIDIPVFYLTSFVINKYLGFSDITVLSVVERIGNIVGKIAKPLQQIIYPEIGRYVGENKVKESLRFSVKISMGIMGSGIIISTIILFTYKLWLGLFLPKYDLQVVIVLMMNLLFLTIINSTQTIHAYFLAFRLMKYNIYIILVVNSLYIFGLIYMTVNYGLLGVMVAKIIQAMLVILIKWYILIKGKYFSAPVLAVVGS